MSVDSNVETLRRRARRGGRAVVFQYNRAAWAVTRARQLPQRFKQLEADVQQNRRLQQRVAELTDVVAEVLVPAADRDDDRIRSVLARYNQTSF
ncbi:DUF6752 domain-containing protein [Jongsikchunia kroppenstedtii]|uniref:DUF6752 domain-containing protein n=1 Tax=Jongsikchunia kroppenstedtii TaxID=1121721 RepID=UPI0003A7C53D